MERFLPILNIIQVRLRDILTRNESIMFSWDMSKLGDIGEDLIHLAWDIYPQLTVVEHRVLYYSIWQAGLGIKNRVAEIQSRRLKEEDKEYFRSVHDALGNICKKIETGEYYQALLDAAHKKRSERYQGII